MDQTSTLMTDPAPAPVTADQSGAPSPEATAPEGQQATVVDVSVQHGQEPGADAAPETKPNADAKPDPKDEGKPEGAPEAYDFKAPEGIELDAGVMDAFSAAAKELNLPQDAAQKMVDKVAPIWAQQQQTAFEGIKAEWADASRADPEFGGDKLNENLAVAKSALEKYGTPELLQLFESSGLGNHPEVIRFLYRTGKTTTEDNFVVGGNTNSNAQSTAQRMYPNMNP